MASYLKKSICFSVELALLLFFFPFMLQAEFSLEITPVEGTQNLDFGSLVSYSLDGEPSSDNASRQVLMIVRNSLGKPYRVTQILEREAINENLSPVKPGTIQYYTVLRQGDGLLRVPNRRNLVLGEQEIFISNKSGDSAEILLHYDLALSPGEQAGHYRTSIRYHLYTTT